MWVQRAKILVIARCGEGEREAVIGIQRLRPELARGHHRVGDVIMVGPGDGIADLHLELDWREGEIVDRYRDGLGMRRSAAELQEKDRGDGKACAHAAEGS